MISGGHPASVAGALAHGLPLLLLPTGSGTPEIAAACADAGVAVVLDEEASDSRWRDSLDALSREPSLRSRAASLRNAFDAYDGPTAACRLIESVDQHRALHA